MESTNRAGMVPGRWSDDWMQRRRAMESRRLGYCGSGDDGPRVHLPWPYHVLKWGLKGMGLYERGRRNFRDVRLHHAEHALPAWPDALSGYRILQISDLHIDLDPSLMDPLCQSIDGVEADLIVFTGDYWEGSHRELAPALGKIQTILDHLKPPRDGFFGILGNHDPLDLGVALEAKGIRMLVNEAVVIDTPAGGFALGGVDDPYYFKLDDVPATAAQCPPGLPRILLSHSPQVAAQASEAGFNLMLSGHTHGGQVCLPGGYSLVKMDQVPWPLFKGPWQYDSLKGYTTTGAGSCHVPVRFNCPPEVTLHTLSSAKLIDENVSGGC